MATIGNLTAFISLNSKKFSKGIARVKKQTISFAKDIGRITAQVGRFGIGLTAVAAGGLTLLMRSSLANINTLKDWSDRLGISARALSALQFAGEQTGVSIETVNMALQRLARRVGEASLGTGEAVKTLKMLGLEAKSLSRLPVDQQLHRIADSMLGVADHGQKMATLMKLLDSEGVGLLTMLKDGSAGLRKFAEEADKLGVIVDDLGANKVSAAVLALDRMKLLVKGLGNIMATEFAPAIEASANKLTEFATAGDGLRTKVLPAIETVITGIAELANFIDLLKAGWHAMSAVGISALSMLSAPISKLAQGIETLLGVLGVDIPTELRILGEFSSGLAASAKEAADRAEAAFAVFKTGENVQAVRDFFDDLRKKADAIATKPPGTKTPGTGLIDLKVLEAAAQKMKALRARAKSIFDATRTPMEKFRAKLMEIKELFSKGLIDRDLMKRATVDAAKGLGLLKKPEAAEADQPGSFEQIVRSRVTLGGAKRQRRDADEEAPKQTVILARIAELLRDGVPARAV